MGDKVFIHLCLPCQELPWASSAQHKHQHMNLVAERKLKNGPTSKYLYRCYHCTALWSFEALQNKTNFQLWPGNIEDFQQADSTFVLRSTGQAVKINPAVKRPALPPGSSWQ